MRREAHYNNRVVVSLLRLENSDLLSFCSSVQKRDPSSLRSVGMTQFAKICHFGRKARNLKKNLKIKIIINRYMKKNYVSPLASEVNVAAETMLAASVRIDGSKTVDTTTENGQLSGGSRGEWGNLWN